MIDRGVRRIGPEGNPGRDPLEEVLKEEPREVARPGGGEGPGTEFVAVDGDAETVLSFRGPELYDPPLRDPGLEDLPPPPAGYVLETPGL